MSRALARLLAAGRRQPVLALAFVAALLLTVLFAARTVLFAVYWADPEHRDHAIEGWMTPRYVAHSWALPPAVLRDALGPLPDRRRPTLDAIAEAQGIPLEALVARVEAAIAAHRASR